MVTPIHTHARWKIANRPAGAGWLRPGRAFLATWHQSIIINPAQLRRWPRYRSVPRVEPYNCIQLHCNACSFCRQPNVRCQCRCHNSKCTGLPKLWIILLFYVFRKFFRKVILSAYLNNPLKFHPDWVGHRWDHEPQSTWFSTPLELLPEPSALITIIPWQRFFFSLNFDSTP